MKPLSKSPTSYRIEFERGRGVARVGNGYFKEISWLMSLSTWLGAMKIGQGFYSSIFIRSFLKFMFLPKDRWLREILYLARYCSTFGLFSFVFLISASRTCSPFSSIIWSRIFSSSVLRLMFKSLLKMSCKNGQM